MKTTGIVDIFLYLKLHLRLIVICAITGAILAIFIAGFTQTYTASVGIQYAHEGAAEGKDPLGGKLNPYEIMQPSLIAQALKELDSELSVEEVRNKLSVTPVYTNKTKEASQALLEKGEIMEIIPQEYNVSFTCAGEYGSEFAKRMLYNLLLSYDTYFAKSYLSMERVPDFMQTADIKNMDYMEACEYVSKQLTDTIVLFDTLVEKDKDFTSLSTGLDFAALRSYYVTMKKNEYDGMYANVRMGLLSKDKDRLIKGYQNRIEQLGLEAANKSAESKQAQDMVIKFYEQYKKNNLYYQARSTQLEADNKNDNKNLVYDIDLSIVINTYDDMLLRYVNSGVDATDLEHDIGHYQILINDFSNDNVSAGVKKELTEQTDAYLEHISELSTLYADLSNKVLTDYYDKTIATNLKYVMSVEVQPGVSYPIYIIVGFGVMLLMGCALAIIIEVVKIEIYNKKMKSISEDGKQGITAKMIDEMSPLEREFYDQSQTGFSEFSFMLQPMVDPEGNWEIAEALVRWSSKRHGQVSPGDFIKIAEKYELMNDFGEWVFTNVCKHSLQWESQGVKSVKISVNFTVQQIQDQSFIDMICKVVSQTRVMAGNIYIEISGGGEMSNLEHMAQKLVAIKSLGIKLSLDHFGEELSSMRVLYELPVDIVKVAKKYSINLDAEDQDPFLRSILDICKEQKLDICMCGIESARQHELAKELGIQYMQGFLYSSPISIESYDQKMLQMHEDSINNLKAEAELQEAKIIESTANLAAEKLEPIIDAQTEDEAIDENDDLQQNHSDEDLKESDQSDATNALDDFMTNLSDYYEDAYGNEPKAHGIEIDPYEIQISEERQPFEYSEQIIENINNDLDETKEAANDEKDEASLWKNILSQNNLSSNSRGELDLADEDWVKHLFDNEQGSSQEAANVSDSNKAEKDDANIRITQWEAANQHEDDFAPDSSESESYDDIVLQVASEAASRMSDILDAVSNFDYDEFDNDEKGKGV